MMLEMKTELEGWKKGVCTTERRPKLYLNEDVPASKAEQNVVKNRKWEEG